MVSIWQLRDLGLTDSQIKSAVSAHRIHRVLRGVYAVGHPGIGRWGALQAAVLACGTDAVISHGSAAALLELAEKAPVLTHVIGTGERGRGIPRIRWHRVPAPGPDEVISREGIPCTTVSRTLVDLAGSVGTSTLRGLIEEAAVQRSLDVPAIDRILSRRRRRGAPALRALLAPWRSAGEDQPAVRSRLEARLWPMLVESGVPLPRTNEKLDLDGVRLEVDFLWSDARLVVETDGAATHGTMPAFGRDRWRDQLLQAAGYRVMRVTWDQLRDEPDHVLDRICSALERVT